ncbi:NUDIX hydrolase [Anaerobacillus alkaliphilus]|uniref:NUDIX hydrolase n=1 Tax=Anaerobacillus alkaliphilus TaxID=1548597 RepID=A0A4Q0VXS9_9BACI|nr:NUDIX hydrolase [Anaerobacillus alkaliphilus]RXJ04280.1 NUDIX hydrolase [Anaerobacillus alkaliphilus]
METELINIYDEKRNHLGVATREEVHKEGYWHETFHCWLIKKELDTNYIYFQLRSSDKKDYPNLLDITAAGHLLANETVVDGIREVKEELGIDVPFDKLVPLGILKYCQTKPGFIDKELANVFLFHYENGFSEFELQEEEVTGIFRAVFDDFYQFCFNDLQEMIIEGYVNHDKQNVIKKAVGKRDFVPHEKEFYEDVARMINKFL